MQDTLPAVRCYRCGAQNLLGESRCTGCGQLLLYTCPKCGSSVNSTFIDCPYCHLILHWPNRQRTDTEYRCRAAGQDMRSGLFVCLGCGTQNVIGMKYCRNCDQQFYYNCPDCNALVNNTLINCPTCRGLLHWPTEKDLQFTFVKNSPYDIDEAGFEAILESREREKAGPTAPAHGLFLRGIKY